MMVLVDTPIWSLALRRTGRKLTADQETLKQELVELIREGRARLLGPVRQELLSGIRDDAQFRKLREHLRAFDDGPLIAADYEKAAEANNRCRRAGIAGSPIDFLICAAAVGRNWVIFTTDRDFSRYAEHLPIRLHTPRPGHPGAR